MKSTEDHGGTTAVNRRKKTMYRPRPSTPPPALCTSSSVLPRASSAPLNPPIYTIASDGYANQSMPRTIPARYCTARSNACPAKVKSAGGTTDLAAAVLA